MYSYEIEQFLKQRSFSVNPEECTRIISQIDNPQIINVKYMSSEGQYLVSTNDGYTFKFWVK